jgi:hypothetical protein
MKKIALLLFITGLIMAGCEKEETNDDTNNYPTSSLKVDSVQRIFLQEATSAGCASCPSGAEQKIALKAFYGDLILPVSVHSQDALAAPIGAIWENNFPFSNAPNFYVMNQDAGTDPNTFIPAYLDTRPIMGASHSVVTTDTSYNVYVKVEVFTTSFNEDYLVMSYLMLDRILAVAYASGIDLHQSSNLPIVQQGSGANPTKWAQDAAFVDGEPQITAGDNYFHDDVLIAPANTPNFWGIPLAEINPFGRDYIEGDIFGSRNTPIILSLPKVTTALVEADLSVVTIIWRLRTDGSGAYDYINGYKSTFGSITP